MARGIRTAETLSYLASREQILAAQLVSRKNMEDTKFHLPVNFSDEDWKDFIEFLNNAEDGYFVGSYSIPEGEIDDNSSHSIIWLKNGSFIIFMYYPDTDTEEWNYYEVPKVPSCLRGN